MDKYELIFSTVFVPTEESFHLGICSIIFTFLDNKHGHGVAVVYAAISDVI